MLPTHAPPVSPGEILVEEFLRPVGLTQAALASRMGLTASELNRIVKGKQGVSARIALLLARELKTSPEFWMNAQAAVDLWTARRALRAKTRAA